MRDRQFPEYPDKADYTTNSPSYYDDLARKNKLIQMLSKRIWEYEETLDLTLEEISNRLESYIEENDALMKDRLDEWDLTIEKFPENVELLLQEWLSDGTLDHIINDTIFNWKADKTYVDEQLDQIVLNVKKFGAKGDGVTNDAEVINTVIQNAPAGATVYFPSTSEHYLLDYWESTQANEPLFVIDKPLKIKGSPNALLKIKDQSELWHKGGRTQLFKVTSSNVVFDSVEIDGNSRNNFEIEGDKVIYYATQSDDCYPTGVSLIHVMNESDDTFVGNVVKNCSLFDSSGSTVTMEGNIHMDLPPVNSTDKKGIIFQPTISNNKVMGGQRSILNFIGGVVGGIMEQNKGEDITYYLCRHYLQTIDCVIRNNTINVNVTEDVGNTYESVTGGIPKTPVNTGYQVGHASRGLGTVRNSIVENNILVFNGLPRWRVTRGIVVYTGVENYQVSNNTITTNVLTDGIVADNGVGGGVIKDNKLFYKDVNSVGLFIRDNTAPIEISGNTFESNVAFDKVIDLAVRAKELTIKDNTIIGLESNGVVFHGTTENILLENNTFNGGYIDYEKFTPLTLNDGLVRNIHFKNTENHSIGVLKEQGNAYISKYLGRVQESENTYYVALEEVGNGFTFGELYALRLDLPGRVLKANIMTGNSGVEHLAHVEGVSGKFSELTMVNVTYNNKDYIALKVDGGDTSADPRYWGVYFTGHHYSENDSLFIINGSETVSESPISSGELLFTGRPADSVGNNSVLFIDGDMTTPVECIIDGDGFIKIKQ